MTADTAAAPWWIGAGAAGLVLLGGAGLVAFVLLGRRGRAESWDRQLARQLPDLRWFADSLAPAVADPSRPVAESQARWRGDLAAVLSTETVLYRLADTGPDAAREARAQSLAEATEALREALDDDVRLRAEDDGAPDPAALADSARAVAGLRRALRTLLEDEPPEAPAG